MDAIVKAAVDAWLAEPSIDAEHKQEIRSLLAAGDERDLTDRFYRELEFGTGGMRGLIGAGLNRMNIYTVGAAAQGLANYILKQTQAPTGSSAPAGTAGGVAIAYDCRRRSDVFAQTTACVLAANGIKAYLFERLRPTPELSFAVRHLGCIAGVVITASHNPPAYNGFKAYWSDGAGVVPPHDESIIREVRAVGSFSNVRKLALQDGIQRGLIQMIGRQVDEAFLAEVRGSCLEPKSITTHGRTLKLVYTALHGTGGQLAPMALRQRGFGRVLEVAEQAQPDGEFPTVASPNPEEAPALNMAIALAQREHADLVIGTDPDADRMGCAVRAADGTFELLTGNQTAALLTWYICEHHTRAGTLPANSVLVTTIVSGDLMKDIARSYGVEVIEVLTGFKWIGEKIRQFEEQGRPGQPLKTYLFGAEESYGYMPCTYTRDKDAITSTCYIADLAAVMAAEGRSLYDLLTDLYRRFGYYHEYTKNVTLPGKEGADKIKAMMASLRSAPPREVAGIPITTVGDCKTGEIRDVSTREVTGRYDLPESDVILLTLADRTKVIARPSGTEPKIKFYILVREPGEDLAAARTAASAKIERILTDVARWTG